MPGGSFVRVEIAYAQSTPTTVYASVDVNSGSIYKSTDGGASYSLVFNGAPDCLANQGWYDNALWVDPTNANTLIVGGIDLWKSINGGVNWTQISAWSLAPASPHADHHPIVEQPGFNGTSNRTVWFANDGGVYGTTNVYTVGVASRSAGWAAFNNNLGITQFYGAAGGTTTGVILGGTQDNGTLKYTPATGTNWVTEFGGDGGASAVDPSNNNNLYGEYSYASVHRSLDGGAVGRLDQRPGLERRPVRLQAGAVFDRRQLQRIRSRTSSRPPSSTRTARTGSTSAVSRCGAPTTRRRRTRRRPARRGQPSRRRPSPATTSAPRRRRRQEWSTPPCRSRCR